jgi:predicted enzyme related to lactoylglutathione lyase
MLNLRLNPMAAIMLLGWAFCHRVVGEMPQNLDASAVWIESAGSVARDQRGSLLYTPESHQSRIGEFQSVAFWCEDVFATAKVLKSKGVAFAEEPKNEPWGSIAIFKDPDGNQFALSSKVNRK